MIGQNPSGEDKWGSVAQGTQQNATTGNPSPSAMQAYTRQYAYDKMGNINQLKQTVGNTFTRNFKYNDSGSNILHSIKKADDITSYSDFTYDVNGNRLTSGSARNYVWDYADQLKSYYNQTGTSEPSTYAQYLYSGGQRVKKLVRNSGGGTDTTIYIDVVFEHRYNSASDEQNLIHVGGVATVRIGDNFGDDVYNSSLTQDACYKLSNHLGSVSFRTRASGVKVDVEEYYPFGDSSVRTWASKKYRYVGKEKDQESGLYYYGARYYAAWTCRFISVDPLAWEYAQLTPYNYAENDPVNDLDIDGMQGLETTHSSNVNQNSTDAQAVQGPPQQLSNGTLIYPDGKMISGSEITNWSRMTDYGEPVEYESWEDSGPSNTWGYSRRVNTPDQGTALSSTMTELESYRFAVGRYFHPEEHLVGGDTYVDLDF